MIKLIRPISNLLVLIVAQVAVLAVAELAVRIFVGPPWPERMPLVRVAPDPDLGWVMVPGDFHYTYDVPVQLNSLGFRGREPGPQRESEYRILAFGDSHVYGQGLEDESLLTTVIERTLNADNLSCDYSVINLGVRAYSINQELALLNKVGLGLGPDHVLLFFYINDFQLTNIERQYRAYRELDWYMFDISSKPTEAALNRWRRIQFPRKSALVMWTYDLARGYLHRDNPEQKILTGDTAERFDQQLAAVKSVLAEFKELTRDRGIAFTVIVIPVSAQIFRAFPNERYQSELSRFAHSQDLDYIDVLPPLTKAYRRTGHVPTIPYDGHYDAAGHEAIGLFVANNLKSTVNVCKAERSK